jgi:hypothetical protein
MNNITTKKRKNILFANLIQNSKELGYKINWKKLNTTKDELLYAKAEIGSFILFADYAYRDEKIYYGLLLSLPLGQCEVLPKDFEESEVLFEIGFNENQKKGLEKLAVIQSLLEGFQLSPNE